MRDPVARLDPARCLRSAAIALRARRIMQGEMPRIRCVDYRANATRSIAMAEEDARRFLRAAVLSGRRRARSRGRS